jgi:hypothetical protein
MSTHASALLLAALAYTRLRITDAGRQALVG